MTGEGLDSPAIMVMEGRYKYIHCDDDPPLLFDRAVDWKETENLAGKADVADVEARLGSIVENNWDLAELKGSVLESQTRRRLIDRAHSVGRTPSWDYDALSPGHTLYFRPCAENPSASNYNSAFEVRARPDAEKPNQRNYP
jgi:choline-sulfatase